MDCRKLVFLVPNDHYLYLMDIDGEITLHHHADFEPFRVAVSDHEIAFGGEAKEGNSHLVILDFTGQVLSLHPVTSSVWSIAFDDSNQKLAVGHENGSVDIYHKVDDDWAPLQAWKAGDNWIVTLLWVREGIILTGSWDGSIISWTCENGQALSVFQEAGGGNVFCFAMRRDDDDVLMSGHDTGVVKRWSYSKAICEEELHLHTDLVRSLCFSDDFSTLYSCSHDNSIAAFDSLSWNSIWRFFCPHHISSLALIDGLLFIGGYDAAIFVLDATSGQVVKTVSEVFKNGVNFAPVRRSLHSRFEFVD